MTEAEIIALFEAVADQEIDAATASASLISLIAMDDYGDRYIPIVE